MKLLVTGGSGLVGRHVVGELSKSHTVDILDVKAPERSSVRYFAANILEPSSLRTIVHDYDAVIHLAGIPHPLDNPPEEVFRVNAVGTFNILEACANGGIKRFIFMSSESTLGFAFSVSRKAPDYLPIDEKHRLRPEDPYGLSKVTAELLCRGYSERSGITTVCLRAPWIWVPEEKERQMYRKLVEEYRNWYKNLWAFAHVCDVARAISLSLTAKFERIHESFFICARHNWTGVDSKTLARKFFPETTEFRPEFIGSASFISTKKAKALIDFDPNYTVSDILA